MRYVKTYEDYYDPPEPDPIFEGVMDRLWEILEDKGYNSDDIDYYFYELDNYQEIYDFILNESDNLSDEHAKWYDELKDKHEYGEYKKLRKELFDRLCKAIAERLYNNLDQYITIDDFLIKRDAEKFNL